MDQDADIDVKLLREIQEKLSTADFIRERIAENEAQMSEFNHQHTLNKQVIKQLRQNALAKDTTKMWMNVGSMFLKFPQSDISKLVEEDDSKIDTEILNIQKRTQNLEKQYGETVQILGEKGIAYTPLGLTLETGVSGSKLQ
eukprot:GFYU01027368.1.p1 GENE.GFYU01027368.1~~GFYU01027368.1.p1  ORF type:complete len:142 (-),score=25.25 GFYU01027368.1:309-734(-)